MTAPRNTSGARTLDGEPPRKKKGLLWLLLGLLALAALIGILAAALGGGDDDDKDKDKAATTTQQQGGTAGGGGGGGAGQLTADGKSLLPVSQAGDLPGFAGKSAEGKSVTVQSVVPNQGFWVGTSKADRLYVEFGGNTGGNEEGGQPKVGDKVNLTGPVKPATDDPGKLLNLDAADAAQVKEQGIYINADEVQPG